MKKQFSFYIGVIVLSMMMAACANDDNYYLKDISSNERSILSFTVPGQIGVPIITKTATEAKVVIYVFSGSDLSTLVPDIQVSYKAKVSPASGQPANFAAGGNHVKYVVTSESGEQREWDVEVKEFSFDLGGTWTVSNHQYYYHVAPSETWGWTGTKNFKGPLPTAAKADDDTFEFQLTSATAEGNIYGTFVHDAGADGETAGYIYNSASGPFDFGYKFNKVPVSVGTWELNFATNTITFNKGQASAVSSLALEWQNEKQTLVLAFDPGPIDPKWDNDWNSDEIHFSQKFWYTLTRSE